MITAKLPFPPRILHPNARPHWAEKAKATKIARTTAFYTVRSVHRTTVGWEGAKLDVTFHAPNTRRRDLDGLIASLKASQDGIADALGIDDRLFETSYKIGQPVKGGLVIVEITSTGVLPRGEKE